MRISRRLLVSERLTLLRAWRRLYVPSTKAFIAHSWAYSTPCLRAILRAQRAKNTPSPSGSVTSFTTIVRPLRMYSLREPNSAKSWTAETMSFEPFPSTDYYFKRWLKNCQELFCNNDIQFYHIFNMTFVTLFIKYILRQFSDLLQ